MTVSAFDQYGNLATNYHFGTAQVVTGVPSDLHGSAAGCAGACPANFGALRQWRWDRDAQRGAVGYKAESGRKMTVKDSVTLAQSSSNAFTVVPADVASFTFSTVSDVTAGALIPSITVNAFDLYGNAATTLRGLDESGRHDHSVNRPSRIVDRFGTE